MLKYKIPQIVTLTRKTRKQINENSTPHLYRMSFAYGYM